MTADGKLFKKFVVARTDGTDGPGGKHEGCRYFVLDIDHDRAAPAAIAAYADDIEWTHPILAEDIRETYPVRESFPKRVRNWLLVTFEEKVWNNITERCHRFIEEALELGQSLGLTKEDAHRLVDYVFSRPLGEPRQEVGGVMVTLGALCSVVDIDMEKEGEVELKRVWTKIDVIRAKQLTKPKHSPLPGISPEE